MKKYGDDADSFHDQGTRVELSKKWHEQNQLRHDYSYRSPSKPKSSYKPKTNYYDNESMMIICPDCGKYYHKNRYWSCPHCNNSKRKSTYKFQEYIVQCPECNMKYNSKFNDECPFCKGRKSKSRSNGISLNSDDWIYACCFGLLIIFFIWAFIL